MQAKQTPTHTWIPSPAPTPETRFLCVTALAVLDFVDQSSTCFCLYLLSAGIKGIHHHHPAKIKPFLMVGEKYQTYFLSLLECLWLPRKDKILKSGRMWKVLYMFLFFYQISKDKYCSGKYWKHKEFSDAFSIMMFWFLPPVSRVTGQQSFPHRRWTSS